ncbi:MAG: HAD family hydrolase [Candidatus Zixiibacteriota bacterium]|nr:MAG: HAD family hydrolase [candidate division Zixibacteria bacterium]
MNQEITTILIDVGWPIIDESQVQPVWNARLKELIALTTGREFSDNDIAQAEADGINCYAPSVFTYIIWQAVKPDLASFYKIRKEFHAFYASRDFRLQQGVREVLEQLFGRFKLGLAANQPVAVYDYLEKAGVLKLFGSTQVSGEIGFAKPDIRMFLAVLDNLGSCPEESLMVGDRQDNDIVPAKLIGMKTVRLLAGPHKIQPVRYPLEAPDYTIRNITELLSLPIIRTRL